MTTQVNGNGHTAPAPSFSEAPSSINIRTISPDGYDVMWTVRGTRVADTLTQVEYLLDWLKRHSWTPAATRQNAPATPQASQEPAPDCDKCGQKMRRRQTKDGTRSFWSCGTKYADGSWCQGKPKGGA